MANKCTSYGKRIGKEFISPAFWRDVIAEGVATFFLVSVQCALPLTWQRKVNALGDDVAFATLVGLGMGFVIIVLVEVFAEMGGANMNPAVSVALCLGGKITFTRALLYVGLQCAGGIGGAAFIYGVTPTRFRDGLGGTALGPDVEPWQGVLVEMWLTAILVIAVYGSTNSRRRKVFMPSIPIGLSIALDHMAGISYTGSSMNPARSLGPALIMNNWKDHWVYWAGPIAGGVFATIIYRFFLDMVDRNPKSVSDE